MSQPTENKKLDRLIKKTLGKKDESGWVVPDEYRVAYKNHLDHFPKDTNFVIDLDDRTITCIDCYVDVGIPFDLSGKLNLSCYAQHILNSEYSQQHVKQRNLRTGEGGQVRPAVKKEPNPDVLDLTEDTKPEIVTLDSPESAHPLDSSSTKRPLFNPPASDSPSKKAKVDDDSPFPVSAEQKQELTNLENRQIRIEAQKRRLTDQTPPAQRTAAFFHQIGYFDTALKNIFNERAQLEAIISGAVPPPVPATVQAGQGAVAGPGPRTTELAARNPAMAAAAQRVLDDERQRRIDQDAAALQAYGQPAPQVADHWTGGVKRGLDSDSDHEQDGDYSPEMRAFDQGIERGSREFNEFLVKAAADDMFDHSSTVEDAAAKIGLSRENPTPPKMKCRLMPHQLMGVAWMVEQEKSDAYGGILGDEMGLGKTVQTIATMTLNPSTDKREKTTLIVAPLALLKQWEREIEEKTKRSQFKVLIYHGQDKKDIKKVKHLLEYDVVITTYQTVVLEWPDEDGMVAKAKKEAKKKGKPEDWENYLRFNKKEGLLFKANFYRIILDEAQFIRNKSTKVSRAIAQLDGLLRWCLTGTPITNKLEDIYPMLRFLQIKPWYNWEEFRNRCVLGDRRVNEAAKRAQAILRRHLFRRKKDSTIDGKPILQLPERTVELKELEFTEEERSIYTAVETQSQITFNKYLKAGTVLKNYAHVLVMLLRLRQVAFHPALLGEAYDEMHDERERQEHLERAIEVVGQDWVDRLKKERYDLAVDRAIAERDGKGDSVEVEECPICLEPATASEGGAVITRCKHIFCRQCIQEVLQAEAHEDDDDDGGPRLGPHQRPCPTCRGGISHDECFILAAFEPPPDEIERVARGGNRLAGPFKRKKADADAEHDEEEEEDEVDTTLGGFIVDDDKDSDSDSEFEVVNVKGKGKAKAKPPKQPNRAVIQDSDDDEVDELEEAEEASESSDEDDFKPRFSAKDKGKGKDKGKIPAGPKINEKMSVKEKKRAEAKWRAEQEPSTKMMWVLNEIKRMEKEDPDDKIIISCSFVSALDMVEDHLVGEGIRVVRFQGDMSANERDNSVQVLKKSKKCKVMLMSLKSGGVGLNLVRANRWISLDLAWSFAVEEQAFARIHRIGQDKEVFVNRLTIANSVEQRIGALQEHKQKIADASLGEGTGAKIGKLSVAELAGLFGLTEKGERVEQGGEGEE